MTTPEQQAREMLAALELPFMAEAFSASRLAPLANLIAENTALKAELEAMRARKDAAYTERNQVVAALSKCFPAGVAKTAIDGWSDDWHGCVYVDLPTGQVSWHFHDSQAHLFAHLPPYAGAWDGHDTAEKYRRLAELEAIKQGAGEPVAWGVPNFRITEKQPLIQVLLDIGHCQYPELLVPLYTRPCVPLTDEPELLEALKRLLFAAQTTGGVAGRDEGLCAAIDAATAVIAKVVAHTKGAKG